MKSNVDNKKCNGLRLLLRGPFPPPYGGIASLLVSLLPGLRDYGADDVVVVHYGNKNETKQVDGAKIYGFDIASQRWRIFIPSNWREVLTAFAMLRHDQLGLGQLVIEATKTILLNKIAKKHRSNVVSFYESTNSLELLPCRKIWGPSKGVALTVFGEIFDTNHFIQERQPLFHRLIASPDAVLSSSNHCACSFKRIGIKRSIEVIYVGVNFERFNDDVILRKQYREQLGVADDTPVILFMGRFHVDMGLDGVIASVPSIIKKNQKIAIIFAGAKGPLCDVALECKRAYPDHIKVINDVPFDLQPSLYAAADIVLAPSRDQRACMGVSIKEAMAAARSVIGTNAGGIPEAIVDGETGLLVPLNSSGHVDNEAFEQAIQCLVDDKERCLAMGLKARERAKDLFGEQMTVQRATDVFMRIMPRG